MCRMCRNEGRGGSFTKPQSQEPTTKHTQFFSRCCWQVGGELWAYTSERFDAASNNSVRDILSLETKKAESAIGAVGKVVHTQKSSVDTHAPKSHAVHHRAAQYPIASYRCCRTTGFQYMPCTGCRGPASPPLWKVPALHEPFPANPTAHSTCAKRDRTRSTVKSAACSFPPRLSCM